MITKYDALTAAAKKITSAANRYTILDLIGSGHDNANATIYDEKAQPASEWDNMFTGSIGALLSTGEYNRHVVSFFTTRGITF